MSFWGLSYGYSVFLKRCFTEAFFRIKAYLEGMACPVLYIAVRAREHAQVEDRAPQIFFLFFSWPIHGAHAHVFTRFHTKHTVFVFFQPKTKV